MQDKAEGIFLDRIKRKQKQKKERIGKKGRKLENQCKLYPNASSRKKNTRENRGRRARKLKFHELKDN